MSDHASHRPRIANTEMAQAWEEEAERWVEQAEGYERMGSRWRRLLDAGLISSTDDVLDVGCGTGKSTRDAARLASSGEVLGVDLSARMLERARELAAAEGLTNVRFEQADAQVHPFEDARFDLVISSFGTMFFADPVAAFTNIGRALRSGGRLAILTWRDLVSNEWVTAVREALAVGRVLPEPPPGAPGPFGLADAKRVRAILDQAGLIDIGIEPIDEPMDFGTDADDAFDFVHDMGIVRGLTDDLDETARAEALEELRLMLAAHETSEGVLLGSSAWLVTARRR